MTLRRPGATVAEAVSRTSEELYAEACRLIPGGVNSPVRSWAAVGGRPLFVQRARGAEVVDADGRSYLDFVGSWGPLLLGHAHPAVVAAIAARARYGTSFGAPTAGEVQLAGLLVAALPSLEQVRLVSSGTEATMSALRLARAATERDLIVKFAGCYHGHVDALLVRGGSGALTLGVPDSPGVPAALAALTLTAEFNDTGGVRELMRHRGPEIAAVIVEPVAGNMGVVPPAPGFLEALREETSRAGALLVFDEVITGFRVAWSGAEGRYGVAPDLTCLGKIIGGGLPLAAFGGRQDLMGRLAPTGPVYQAGTLSGNPLSVAADPVPRGRAGVRLRRRTSRGHCPLRPLLPRHAGRGHLPAAVAIRGDVRLAGTHRERHRSARPRGKESPWGPARSVGVSTVAAANDPGLRAARSLLPPAAAHSRRASSAPHVVDRRCASRSRSPARSRRSPCLPRQAPD